MGHARIVTDGTAGRDGGSLITRWTRGFTTSTAERGNSLLKTTFKALRRISLRPWRIGAITAAALVLLHHEAGRTT